MTDKARIALAEAMGWSDEPDYQGVGGWMRDGKIRFDCPDPFIDANDDYAVVEWLRDNHWKWLCQKDVKLKCYWFNYRIGDYARAACKVLEIDCD